MSYVTSVRTRGKTQSVKIRREKTLHKSCNVVYRSVSMAARSAQRSTALATVPNRQALLHLGPDVSTPLNSRSLTHLTPLASVIHPPLSLSLLNGQPLLHHVRSRRDFSARRCNSFSSQLSIPTTPCSIYQ